jgi:hypothetical protein
MSGSFRRLRQCSALHSGKGFRFATEDPDRLVESLQRENLPVVLVHAVGEERETLTVGSDEDCHQQPDAAPLAYVRPVKFKMTALAPGVSASVKPSINIASA